jgi:hypothetical protein
MIVGGIVCALAAPLYLPALRAERRRGSTEFDRVVVASRV